MKDLDALGVINHMLDGVEEFEFIDLHMVLTRDLEKVKQALLDAKRFKEIVVTHNIHIGDIKHCNNVEKYNSIWDDDLTEDEFELLKRYCNENNKNEVEE